MTALLILAWPHTVALGRRNGAVMMRRLFEEERGLRVAGLVARWHRRHKRVVVDVEVRP